jgi:hypothetical protein
MPAVQAPGTVSVVLEHKYFTTESTDEKEKAPRKESPRPARHQVDLGEAAPATARV